jgi:secreted Zn-dependent insulinase-like peptidase
MLQMTRSSASTTSPFNHFATGNEDTLWTDTKKQNVDIVKTIKDFHATYYSPSLMKLVVVSAEPLEAIRAQVESLFGAIPDKAVVLPQLDSRPWKSEDLQRVFRMVPTSTSHTLRLIWALPELERDYAYAASHYVANCVGHESAGSILAELKRLGWANQLMAGPFETLSTFVVFGVEIDLTEQGLEHTDDIAVLVYDYIAMMKRHGVDHDLFRELAALNHQAFLFAEKQEPSSYATAIASNMATGRSPKHYLRAGQTAELFEPKRIEEMLQLLNVANVNVYLRSPTFAGQCPLRERWYGTEYQVRHVADGMLSLGGAHADGLSLSLSLSLSLKGGVLGRITAPPMRGHSSGCGEAKRQFAHAAAQPICGYRL